MQDTALISSKLEDYLETICKLVVEHRVARVSDIAQRMGVQMPTVTGALKHLAGHGLVNYEPYQFVTLTDAGADMARGLIRRHNVLRKLLIEVLRLDADVAEQDACGMEHALSEQTLARLIKFVEFIETCPRAGRSLIDRFRACVNEPPQPGACENCIRSCLAEVERRGPGPQDAPEAGGDDVQRVSDRHADGQARAEHRDE